MPGREWIGISLGQHNATTARRRAVAWTRSSSSSLLQIRVGSIQRQGCIGGRIYKKLEDTDSSHPSMSRRKQEGVSPLLHVASWTFGSVRRAEKHGVQCRIHHSTSWKAETTVGGVPAHQPQSTRNLVFLFFLATVIRASRTSPTLLMDIDLTSGTSSE